MARITLDQAQTFPEGNNVFLSLSNDKDSVEGRFAYASYMDIPVDTIHSVKGADGRIKNISCMRETYDQPTSVCPLCNAGHQVSKVVYFNFFNFATNTMTVWQRSEAYYRKNLIPLFQDLENQGLALCSVPFKIERNGAKGDSRTTYVVMPRQADGTMIDSLPEEIDVMEMGIIKDLTYEEMNTFLTTGNLPELRQAGSQGFQNQGFQGDGNVNRRSVGNTPQQGYTQPVAAQQAYTPMQGTPVQEAPMSYDYNTPVQDGPVAAPPRNRSVRGDRNGNGSY